MTFNKKLKKVVEDIAKISRYLWERGWAERNAGNISVDITEIIRKSADSFSKFAKKMLNVSEPKLAGRTFFVTITGSYFRDIADEPEKNLLVVRITNKLDGYHILWNGKQTKISKPTSEFVSHIKIHEFLRKNNLPQKVVLHTHPTHLIALTHIKQYTNQKSFNLLLWKMHPEIKIVIPDGVGFTPYKCPGTNNLAEVTITSLTNRRITVWEKHGCIATGKDVSEAFDLIDTANKSAEIFFLCKMAGYEPQGLNETQLDELAKI